MSLQDELLPDWLWQEVSPLLPVHVPSSKGGRPRADDRPCLLALIYMLREGGTWRRLPRLELACPSHCTVWRRLQEWSNAGLWEKLHQRLLNHLGSIGQIDTSRVIADSASSRALFGGVHTGPNPTDRGKQGLKRHVLSDANGLPLVVQTGPANQNDHQRLQGLIEWMPMVPTKAGKPRRVMEVMADAGYGVLEIILWVLSLGYRSRIKPRGNAGKVHGSGLGQKRYVVERTHAWFGNFRRLRLCYERTWHSTQGWHELAACVICARRWESLHKRSKKIRL